MKKILMAILAVTGVLVFASPGVVLAGAYHGESTGSGIVSEEMRSMEGAPRDTGPEAWSFEYQEALETGSLPLEGGLASTEPAQSVVTNEPQEFELGGFHYRIGVDTGD